MSEIVPPITTSNDQVQVPDATTSSENTYLSNRNQHRSNRRSENELMLNSKGFIGETPELEAVIGLLSEKLDKGVTMEQFQEKLKLYVLKNFGEDVVALVSDFYDPRTDFETKHAPIDLSTEEAKRPGSMKKWEMKYKKYLDREENLDEKINKLYALIMGQCTIAVRSVIKDDPDFTKKSRDFDALWILEKVKTNSAGVESKAKPVLSYHEQLLFFLNMRQDQNENDDGYLTRFNSKAKI